MRAEMIECASLMDYLEDENYFICRGCGRTQTMRRSLAMAIHSDFGPVTCEDMW